MSILSELKKLTNKNNATVISEALPDSMSSGESSGGGAFIVREQPDGNGNFRLDKTYADIFEAVQSSPVILIRPYNDSGVFQFQLVRIGVNEKTGALEVVFHSEAMSRSYYAATTSDYPAPSK